MPPAEGFWGRDDELTRISQAVFKTAEGKGQLLLVQGEAGIGKTRILREASTIARDNNFFTVDGSCFEEQGVPPLWPWIKILRTLAADLGWETVRSVFRGSITRLAPFLPEIDPGASDDGAAADGESEQSVLFNVAHSFVRLFEQASGKKPLLVTIDDIQWADSSTLTVTRLLARMLGEHRVLLVLALRTASYTRDSSVADVLYELSRLPYYDTCSLRALEKRETMKCLLPIVQKSATEAAEESIYDITSGIPLLVVQLGHLLASRKTSPVLEDSDIKDIAVISGMSAVIGQQLRRLTLRTRELLEKAAFVGPEFSLKVLIAIAGAEPSGVLSIVDEGISANVIEQLDTEGSEYGFVHDLIRQALVSGVSPGTRMKIHAGIAKNLEVLWQDSLDNHAGELLRHYLAAGAYVSNRKTAEYARISGEKAYETGAFEAAARYFDTGLTVLGDGKATEQTARLHSNAAMVKGRAGHRIYLLADAYRHCVSALKYYEDANDVHGVAALVRNPALLYLSTSYTSDPENIYTRCLTMIEEGSESHEYARVLVGASQMHSEELSKVGTRYVTDALQRAQKNGNTGLQLLIHRMFVLRCRVNGNYDEWLSHLKAIISLIESTPTKNLRLFVGSLAAEVAALISLRKCDEAGEKLERLLEFCENLDRPDLLVTAKIREIRFLQLCSTDMANQLALIEVLDRISMVSGWEQMSFRSIKLATWLLLGKEREIIATVENMIEAIRDGGIHIWYPEMLTIFCLYSGTAECIEALEEICNRLLATPLIHAGGAYSHVWRAGLATVALCRGEAELAASLYENLGPEMSDFGYYTLGTIAMRLRRWDEAIGLLTKALDYSGCFRVWAAVRLSEAFLGRGQEDDTNRAIAHVTRARAEAEELGMVTVVAEAERVLKSQRIGTERRASKSSTSGLTIRETDILTLIAAGKANKEIAYELGISPRTVGNHVRNILRKTGAGNRTEAALYAIRHGIVKD